MVVSVQGWEKSLTGWVNSQRGQKDWDSEYRRVLLIVSEDRCRDVLIVKSQLLETFLAV